MKLTKSFLLLVSLLISTSLFAREGGDDAGNGGFAYKQSIAILKLATTALEEKIRLSTLKDLVDYPERRLILQDTLSYDRLSKLYDENQHRGGRKLAMNYIVNPATVVILEPYYIAFMGRVPSEMEEASLEVQKRLLHEASHIWGYKEADSEKFSIAFLKNIESPPVEESKRPSDIAIGDICSCINGRSELTKSCDKFCAEKPVSDQPILYVNTILGAESTMKFGNLYNWCTVQLNGDMTSPQCALQTIDGESSVSIPVSISPGSNSFRANVLMLARYRTWNLKLVETKTGSNAQTGQFQIKRKDPGSSNIPVRKIKIMPINQYTCMSYGGRLDSAGNVIRTTFVRLFYYFQSIDTPAPIPPVGGNRQSQIVCHDEQLHPGNDSVEYVRLERLVDHVRLWDLSDIFFKASSENGNLKINKVLEDRLADEFGMPGTSLNLFRSLSFLTRPNFQAPLGYVLIPFNNPETEISYCPTSNEYNGNLPLLNLLGEYMADTEALYVAEKEAETIQDGTVYKTIYGTMLVRENVINKYGFYIENGQKILITEEIKHSGRTIYYFWPTSNTTDPLTQAGRKLFVVRTPDTLNGIAPAKLSSMERTSDKRIGCIPKGVEL